MEKGQERTILYILNTMQFLSTSLFRHVQTKLFVTNSDYKLSTKVNFVLYN